MPSVFLHTGGFKTGTSAFQAFIRDERDWLAQQGFYVPAVGQTPEGAHHTLARAVAGLPGGPPAHAEMPDLLRKEIEDRGRPTLLISSENIGHIFHRPAFVDSTVEFFKGLGYEINVIHYLRHDPPSVNAKYSQQVKTLDRHLPFAQFVDKVVSSHTPNDWWVNVFNHRGLKARFLPYNRAVQKKGIVNAILGELGAPSHTGPSRSINASPTVVQVMLARWMARSIAETEEKPAQILRQRLSLAIPSIMSEKGIVSPSYMGLDTDSAHRIEMALADNAERLARTVWGSSWADAFPGEAGQAYTSNDPEVCGIDALAQGQLDELQAAVLARWIYIKKTSTHIAAKEQPLPLRQAMNLAHSKGAAARK